MISTPDPIHAVLVGGFDDRSIKIRNRVLVGILRRTNFMERLGSGYERIRTEMSLGYPEPVWEEVGTSLRVTLRPHPHLSASRLPAKRDRSRQITNFIRGQGEATADEISEAVGLSKRQVQTYIGRLRRAGELETTKPPHSPDQGYRLTEQAKKNAD